MTDNITNSANDTCLLINASNVILDGQGHTIDGNGTGTHGIHVFQSGGSANVTVSNVIVTDWNEGIEFERTARSAVENVTASGNTIGVALSFANTTTIANSTSTNNTRGIYLSNSPDNVVRNTTATANGNRGVFVESGDGNRLVEVVASSNSVGINATVASDLRVVDTVAANNTRWDIRTIGESSRNTTAVNVSVGTASMNFTARAVALTGVDSPPDDPRGRINITQHVNVTNTDTSGALTDPFVSYFDVNVTYNETTDLPTGVKESDLLLFNHTAADGWQRVPGTAVDTDANVVTANISSSGGFEPAVVAPLGELTGPNISRCRNVSSAGSYRLVENITDASDSPCLWITANDVIVDGQGHTVDGTGTGTGILVSNASSTVANVTVRNGTATDWNQGLRYETTDNATVRNVTASDSQFGIVVDSSTNASVTDGAVANSTDGVLVTDSDDATVANLTATNSSRGLVFESTTDSRLLGGTVAANGLGVALVTGNDHILSNFNATDNDVGVNVSGTDDVSIRDSTVADNGVWDVRTGDEALNATATDLTLTNATVSFVARDVAIGGVASVPADPVGQTSVGVYFNATNTDPDTSGIIDGDPSHSYLNVSVAYHVEEVHPDASTESLRLYGHNGTAWDQLPNQTGVNTTANTVNGNISNVDVFAGDAFAPLANFTGPNVTACRDIAESGAYRLVGNLTNVTDSPCVHVAASDVTLDGNGFVLDGTGPDGSVGIRIAGSATVRNVTVTNLTATDFGNAVQYDDTNGTNLTDARLAGNRIGANLTDSHNVTVEAVTVTGATNGILGIGGADVTLINSTIVEGTVGVTVDGTDRLRVERSVVRANGIGINATGAADLSLVNVTARENADWDLRTGGGSTNTTAVNLSMPSTRLRFSARDVALVEADSSPAPPRNHDDVDVFVNATNTSADSFLNASLAYDEADVGTFDESTIRLWRHDETSGNWSLVSGSSVASGADRVLANVTEFSTFAPLGNLTGSEIAQCRDISAPGRYELVENITNVTESPCFRITASDVILDGQGFAVNGSTGPGTVGVFAHNDTAALRNVTVEDIAVRRFGDGILYQAVNESRTNATILTDNDVGLNLTATRNVTIEETRVSGGLTGIRLAGGRDAVLHSTLIETAETAVRINNSSSAALRTMTVRDGTVGVLVTAADNVTLTDVNASSNADWDVRTVDNATNTTATNLSIDTATATFTARDVALVAASDPPEPPEGTADIGQFVNGTGTNSSGPSPSFLDITLAYTDDDVAALNESTLRMHRFNGTGWVPVPNSTVDESRNVVTANVSGENVSLLAPLANLSQNDIADCTAIDAPGSYRLVTDVDAATTPCIEINTSDVTIDGQGFNLTGTGGESTTGLAVSGPVENVTVRNLSAVEFDRGLDLANVTGGTIENVTLANNRDGVVLTNATGSTLRHVDAPNDRWSFRSVENSTNLTVEDLRTGTGTVTFRRSKDVAIGPNESAPSPPDGTVFAGSNVTLTNTSADSFVALTLTYDPSGVDESTIELRRHTGSDWAVVPNSTVDTAANRVSANVTAFSVFAAMGDPSSDDGDGGDGVGGGGGAGSGGGGGSGGAIAPPSDTDEKVRVVSASLSADRVEPGGAVTVTGVVRNDRQSDATHEVTLYVDGEAVDSRYVTVPANDTTDVTFHRSFERRGEYAIAVNDVSAGTLTVAEPTPTPTETTVSPTPDATPSPTRTPTGTARSPTATATPGSLGGIAPFAMALGAIVVFSIAGAGIYLRYLRP